MAKGFLKRKVFSFLEKPIHLPELENHLVEALTLSGKLKKNTKQIRAFDEFEIDFQQRAVRSKGHQIRLTPTEFELLTILTSKIGQVITRAEVHKQIWGETAVAKNVLDTHLLSLRKKVPEFSQRLAIIYGVGFSFN